MKGVDRVEHVKSGKGARLALVTTLVRMGWVTLGATPWACCARYVRYTRKGFPPQTRPPSRSSRLRVAEADKCVKGRNYAAAAVVWGESWKLAVDITWSPGVALELELGGSCGRLVPERPAILPFAAALPRLHSYSFPFDLHVGSNCGGGGGGSAAAQLRLNLHYTHACRHGTILHKYKETHGYKYTWKYINKLNIEIKCTENTNVTLQPSEGQKLLYLIIAAVNRG